MIRRFHRFRRFEKRRVIPFSLLNSVKSAKSADRFFDCARRELRPARLCPNPYHNSNIIHGGSMSTEVYSPGLEGVIAGETAISTVTGGLRYRGYPVTELAEKCTFDEVAYLLLYGELPTPPQLADFQKRVAAAREIPPTLRELLKNVPK